MENSISFFYWVCPNTAYQVSDYEIAEKLKASEVEQKKTGGDGILTGVIAVFLANLLRPLAGYFKLPGTPLLVLSLFFYINKKSKKSLYQVVDLKQYTTKRLWIRPQSYKSFFSSCFPICLF